ncbi:hypothetical protein BX661DRAFT_213168 [Kickxella alabastrina]|uniref:uncharacterized protein n=1 Tax=Kickxella alabastrina TaxID=61397 RepID=UPI00221F7595|nr:uncharacterized protein BX661DRAFT_213168 [Kickxella alabastrina]KAI7826759.1 hypothetical protein BX661DRAFT_213168 [Kickxella alabastrina]
MNRPLSSTSQYILRTNGRVRTLPSKRLGLTPPRTTSPPACCPFRPSLTQNEKTGFSKSPSRAITKIGGFDCVRDNWEIRGQRHHQNVLSGKTCPYAWLVRRARREQTRRRCAECPNQPGPSAHRCRS